jgi:hypothetical protein
MTGVLLVTCAQPAAAVDLAYRGEKWQIITHLHISTSPPKWEERSEVLNFEIGSLPVLPSIETAILY